MSSNYSFTHITIFSSRSNKYWESNITDQHTWLQKHFVMQFIFSNSLTGLPHTNVQGIRLSSISKGNLFLMFVSYAWMFLHIIYVIILMSIGQLSENFCCCMNRLSIVMYRHSFFFCKIPIIVVKIYATIANKGKS